MSIENTPLAWCLCLIFLFHGRFHFHCITNNSVIGCKNVQYFDAFVCQVFGLFCACNIALHCVLVLVVDMVHIKKVCDNTVSRTENRHTSAQHTLGLFSSHTDNSTRQLTCTLLGPIKANLWWYTQVLIQFKSLLW